MIEVQTMNGVRKWSIWLVVTAVAVVVSYTWLDRPIAIFAHDQLQHFDLFQKLTYIPEFTTPLVLIGFVALSLWGLSGHALSRLQTVLVLDAACLAVAVAVKDQLKFAFGRTWPETWVRNNPSFIHDGIFGFNPFHGGAGYASFPSGHATAICAVVSVFWICYPRYRVLYGACGAAVAIGLVGANFHFLSDVIAGAFLGCSVGCFSVSLWELGARKLRPQPASPQAQAAGARSAEARSAGASSAEGHSPGVRSVSADVAHGATL